MNFLSPSYGLATFVYTRTSGSELVSSERELLHEAVSVGAPGSYISDLMWFLCLSYGLLTVVVAALGAAVVKDPKIASAFPGVWMVAGTSAAFTLCSAAAAGLRILFTAVEDDNLVWKPILTDVGVLAISLVFGLVAYLHKTT